MTNEEINLSQPTAGRERRIGWMTAAGLTFALLLAYSNSFSGSFFLDDVDSIVNNRSLADFRAAWSPPVNAGVAGRPLLNLSFAVNYAIGKLDPRGYHAVNLLIHVGAALLVFGLVGRTLRRPQLRGRYGHDARWLALTVALLWALHPLQTESVTYVSQRAESLMGLCLLLTLYCFVRSVETSRAGIWRLGSGLACLAGMGVKETMVVAPIVVWLYDGVFMTDGLQAAWRQRWHFYLGLAATWLWLGWLMATSNLAARGIGFASSVPLGQYALVESGAIIRYLRLALWPAGLVVDYGFGAEAGAIASWFDPILIGLMVAGAAFAWWRARPVGFLLVLFLLLLAPTSSLVPIVSQPVAEHRMYLPLLTLVVLAVAGMARWRGPVLMGSVAILVTAAGVGSWLRNRDYLNPEIIWNDVLAKVPGNARAWCGLGQVRLEQGRLDEARRAFEQGVKIRDNYEPLHFELGNVFVRLDRPDQAIAEFAWAVKLTPEHVQAQESLAVLLARRGRYEEAFTHFVIAMSLSPENAAYLANACVVLRQLGRFDEAVRYGEEAIRMAPASYEAHGDLAMALLAVGRIADAMTQYREWLRLQPPATGVDHEFAMGLIQKGRIAEARDVLENISTRNPTDAQTHNLLGVVFAESKQRGRARQEFERALRLQPDAKGIKENLDRLLALPPELPP